MNWPTALTFVEAFLTVEVAGLGGVMLTSGSVYTWPSLPALFFISLGGVLAGVRRVQALNAPVPKP